MEKNLFPTNIVWKYLFLTCNIFTFVYMESFLGLNSLYFLTNHVKIFYMYMLIIRKPIDYSLNHYPNNDRPLMDITYEMNMSMKN